MKNLKFISWDDDETYAGVTKIGARTVCTVSRCEDTQRWIARHVAPAGAIVAGEMVLRPMQYRYDLFEWLDVAFDELFGDKV